METLPFATQPAPYSVWGCSDGVRNVNVENKQPSFRTPTPARPTNTPKKESCDSTDLYARKNLEYMPAVLLNTLKKDKKPFTYTPGRIDLSEVLNDKLQKRRERRQKRAEERSLPMSPVPDMPTFESQKQVLVMPTYNSPLNMYSMENAIEALEVQAELTVADNSPIAPSRSQSMTLPRNYKYEPKDFEAKNVTQSKAFKVLQIITDTEEEQEQNDAVPKPTLHNEMRFTGIRPSEEIPSKFFHHLQRMTANGGEESGPVTYQSGITNNIDHYHDEMRFSGTRSNKVIPSKLFHNLQRMTGTEDEQELHNDTAKPYTGPVNVSDTGVRFRPKDDSLKQAKQSPASPNQQIRKELTYSSIPFLQRPAAFLPANQSATAKNASCCARFNSMNMHQNCHQPFRKVNY